jgi:hypothetical protein
MKYFLRFTETPERDLRRGTDLLTLPPLDETEKVDGLCGFYLYDEKDVKSGHITEEEMYEKVKDYRDYFNYKSQAVIYEGEYCHQKTPNGEGDTFTASGIYKIY